MWIMLCWLMLFLFFQEECLQIEAGPAHFTEQRRVNEISRQSMPCLLFFAWLVINEVPIFHHADRNVDFNRPSFQKHLDLSSTLTWTSGSYFVCLAILTLKTWMPESCSCSLAINKDSNESLLFLEMPYNHKEQGKGHFQCSFKI